MSVHQDLVLNAGLSVTSRLLYVVLQARVDDGISLEDVAPLVGLESGEQVRPFLDELVDAGVVETRRHRGRAPGILLYQAPLSQERRTHECIGCERCGECSCEHIKGLCRICDEIERVERAAQEDVERWQRQRDARATYAIGRGAARLHRWDCPSLSSPEKSLDQLESSRPYARTAGWLHWSRLPDLYTAQELRLKGCRKRRCAMCGPDPL
ncbi:hypothetical protein OG864_00105 [Streptomyces sp. NBC_00124]|uniref:hypothetical protein n=1 Tax=Streptomyces sp. NBC_00124 TaxID=2975662 RepID=UPI002255598F|nr:hypothetical protein [Streptomyces sp. NBC_00124]MCX5357195.1 hypothetical protein [Streptomyces sp. NBC_00124]